MRVQDQFNPHSKPALAEGFRTAIRSLSEETADGRIRRVGLNEPLETWGAEYNFRPNLLDYNWVSRLTRVTVSLHTNRSASSSDRAFVMS